MTAYTRTEHLRHELAEQIRNGTLKPGERIMSETRLAESTKCPAAPCAGRWNS